MRALILNCPLKASPEKSNTEALFDVVRVVDHDVKPGVTNDEGDGHEWSEKTGRTAASNLVAVARALAERPIPAPPG